MTESTTNEKRSDPRLPWYKWHVYDWATDDVVQMLDWQAQGIYRHLLDRQWIEGSIPADPDRLAASLKMDPMFFRKVWDLVGTKFTPGWGMDGRLVNEKLAKQREEAILEYERKVEAAAKAGRASGESRRKDAEKRRKRRERYAAKKEGERASNGRSTAVERKRNDSRTDTDTDTDTDLTTTTPPPTATAPKKTDAVPDTWLTPFDDEWKTHYGAPYITPGRGRKSRAGDLAKNISAVERQIAGEMGFPEKAEERTEEQTRKARRQTFIRWRAYASEKNTKHSAAHFARVHGLYKGGKFAGGHDVRRGSDRQPVGRPARVITPTVGPGSAK